MKVEKSGSEQIIQSHISVISAGRLLQDCRKEELLSSVPD